MSETQAKYISDKKVAARYGIARSTVWYLVKRGLLPSPTKISANITRWNIATLDAHDTKYA